MFQTAKRPFPRWIGPYSPARGNRSGFRFNQGHLGTWVESETGSNFWSVLSSSGSIAIEQLVKSEWGGGRILFLPNGYVIKPLPNGDEVGQRVVIGKFSGSIVLETPDGNTFDLSNPGNLRPGQLWLGPKTIGLECAIQTDGSLMCNWYHPTTSGREDECALLYGPDTALANGFYLARPRNSGGRVRVTAHGHVITNRQEANENWTALYVGRIGSDASTNWQQWIKKERI